MAFDINATLGYVVNRTSVILRQELQRRFQAAGQRLTAEEWALIGQLWRDDGLSRQALADLTIKEQTTVTRLLDGLAAKGLVRREHDQADRRVVRIWLTDDGRALEARLAPLALDMIAQASDAIPQADIEITVRTLQRIQVNLLGGSEDKSG